MELRIPITEEFLWDIFKVFQGAEDAIFSYPSRWDEVANPDLRWIRRNYQKKLGKRRFSQLIYYLKRKGYLKEKISKEKKGIILTPRGKEKILKIRVKKIKKDKRADGKWLMVFFDIPEDEREKRDIFRDALKSLDFKYIQKSIWATPFDILDEVKKIIEDYSLEKFVKLLLVEEIEV